MNDNIDEVLQDIANSYEKSIEKDISKKETPAKKEIVENISDIIIEKVNRNDAISKQIYDLFYGDLATGRDKSSSSKDSLLRSLESSVENNKTLVELVKALVKKEQGTSSGGNVGVFIGTKPGDEFGIDVKNIQDSIEED